LQSKIDSTIDQMGRTGKKKQKRRRTVYIAELEKEEAAGEKKFSLDRKEQKGVINISEPIKKEPKNHKYWGGAI